MNRKTRDVTDAIERMFEEEQVSTFSFSHNAKHVEVQFQVGAQLRRYSFAGTPGDRRTVLNTVAGIRRIIRATRTGARI